MDLGQLMSLIEENDGSGDRLHPSGPLGGFFRGFLWWLSFFVVVGSICEVDDHLCGGQRFW